MAISKVFTDAQLETLLGLRAAGEEYASIVKTMRAEFGIKVSADAVRRAWNNYKSMFQDGSLVIPTTQAPKPRKPVTQRKRAGKEDNSRILVISDMHIPYQHPDTVAFLAAIKAKYKPTRVVCIGDEVDSHNLSFHDTDPDLFGAGDELQAAIRELQPIYKMFPKVDLVDSNHGSMVYRRGKHHGIPRKYLRDYGDVLDAPTGWVWQHDLAITLPTGNIAYFHHGLAADVMKIVNLRGTCVIQGHYHTAFRIGYAGNPDALLWGMNVGCLIDGHSMAFAYDKTNLGRPVVGVGMIIDGLPKLLPMTLVKGGRWNGVIP